MKQDREHFHSSKSGHIDNRASFPDNITPEERVRAQVGTPLTSLYTEHYCPVNAWPMPQQYSSSINSQWKRYLFPQVQYTNGYSKQKEKPDYQFEVRHLAAATSRDTPHLRGCVFQSLSNCLSHGLPFYVLLVEW